VALGGFLVLPAQAGAATSSALQWYSADSPHQMGGWDGDQLDQYAEAPLPVFGGTAPYTATLVSGAVPTGLTLESDGVVAGNALMPQKALFTVQVTDSSAPAQTITGQVVIWTGDTDTDPNEIQTDNDFLSVPGAGELGSAFVELHALGLNPAPVSSGQPSPVGDLIGEAESLASSLGCEVLASLPFRGCILPG
jgi:hypothetical protein